MGRLRLHNLSMGLGWIVLWGILWVIPVLAQNESPPDTSDMLLSPIMLGESDEAPNPTLPPQPLPESTVLSPDPKTLTQDALGMPRFPIFREEIRLSDDFTRLQAPNASMNFILPQYIRPFAHQRGAIRTILPIQQLSTPTVDQAGVGDLAQRISYIAKREETWGWMVGTDLFWPTASERFLGTRKMTVAPRTMLAKALNQNWLIAPTYQYLYSYGGSDAVGDIRLSRLDCYVAWHTTDFRRWLVLDPALFLSHTREHNRSATIRLEYGQALTKRLGIFIRPGIGIGNVRPYNWALEIGLRYFPSRQLKPLNLTFF